MLLEKRLALLHHSWNLPGFPKENCPDWACTKTRVRAQPALGSPNESRTSQLCKCSPASEYSKRDSGPVLLRPFPSRTQDCAFGFPHWEGNSMHMIPFLGLWLEWRFAPSLNNPITNNYGSWRNASLRLGLVVLGHAGSPHISVNFHPTIFCGTQEVMKEK